MPEAEQQQHQHAKYSPSKLPRIIACPASALYESPVDQAATSSSYADEGTLAHALMAECLDNGIYIPTPALTGKYQLTKSVLDAIQFSLDYAYSLKQSYIQRGVDVYDLVEQKVSLAGFVPSTNCEQLNDVAGTLDYALVAGDTLHIVDWKFGAGIEVYPDTPQLLAYALGKIAIPERALRYRTVHCTIVQPRITTDEHVKTHIISMEDLLLWLHLTLVPALISINSKHPIFKPSVSTCRWCPIKNSCAARKASAAQVAAQVFALHDMLPSESPSENSTEPDPDDLTVLLDKAPILRQYLDDLEDYVRGLLLSGRAVPGYKLVSGRSTRQWANEQQAKDWCFSRGYDEYKMSTLKFASPAQAEKILPKALVKDPEFLNLIVKPEGKPTLVKETDKRPALTFRTAAEIFADFTDTMED